MKVAIVGSGIAGIAAAHRLAPMADVTLFDAAGKLGGHTDSHSVYIEDKVYAVDTGFIAFNTENYPQFSSWLKEMGVPVQRTDMSFSASVPAKNLEYSTASWSTFFSSMKLWTSPGHYRMLFDMRRFCREATKASLDNDLISIGEYLRGACYSQRFINLYMAPFCATLWSQSLGGALALPLQHVVSFMQYHNMLSMPEQPQ